MSTFAPAKVFLSYSHKDEIHREALGAHMSPLVREGIVTVWHDRKLSPGSNWEHEIEVEINEAEIHLLLVSPDFFASDYCYSKEMALAIEKHNRGETVVVPVLIRPVDWKHSKLARIQALPKDAIPIAVSEKQDVAWLNVIEGIRKIASRVIQQRKPMEKGSSLPTMALADLLGVVIEDIEKLYNRDDPTEISGIPTGFRDLDQLTDGLHPGEITLVASAPAMDREGFLLAIAAHVAVHVRLPVVFVCTQLDKKYIASRIISTVGRISVAGLRTGRLDDDDWDRLTNALGMLHEQTLEVITAPSASINDLLPLLDQLAERFGAIPLIVIDSLAHFAEEKAVVLRRLREYLHGGQKSVLIGAGLEFDPGLRADSRPLISDLGQWAAINEDIDRLMFLYFDQLYHRDTTDVNIAEVTIARSRSGELPTLKLAYHPDSQSFDNYPSSYRFATRYTDGTTRVDDVEAQ